jgi:hypothetical protein
VKVAFHFNAGHPDFGNWYGRRIEEITFREILDARTVHLSSKIYIGDLPWFILSPGGDAIVQLATAWFKHGQNVWHRFTDSRKAESFGGFEKEVGWIVTSPPYYGMRTYVPDQWLRRWFLGGPSHVDYSVAGQLSHFSQKEFADGLRTVWKNCASVAKRGCRMVVRFGAINDRKVDARELIGASLTGTGWRMQTCHRAGSASAGRRQADSFVTAKGALEEYDVWARLEG